MSSVKEPQPLTTTAIAQRPQLITPVIPRNVSELSVLGEMMWKGGLCPKSVTRGEAASAIIQFGLEVGIMPAAALSSIHVTGGKGTIWGQMPLAMVRKSGLLEFFDEWIEGEGDNRTGVCVILRKGDHRKREYRYSVGMARKAGLIGRIAKDGKPVNGPWETDTDMMLKYRARNRNINDVFGDVLSGLVPGDAEDYPQDHVNTTAEVTHATTNQQVETNHQQPPTPVVGVPMVDDGQLFDIKRHRKHWYLQNGFTSDEDPLAFTSWQAFLRGAFNVESATKLTQEQAKELIALLIESDPHPLNAVLSGKDSESTAAPQATADGQPATQTTATTTNAA